MGKRGPKPTPSVILAARGSWRAGINATEALPEPCEPDLPAEVKADPDALAIWNRVIPRLVALRLASKIDGEALGTYAMLRAIRQRAYAVLAAARKANPGQSPEQSKTGRDVIAQIRDLTATIRAIETDFGMTPSSRARIVLPSDKTKGGENDSPRLSAASFMRRPA